MLIGSRLLRAIVIAISIGCCGLASDTSCAIRGQVFDAGLAVLPAVQVILVEPSTEASSETSTDEDGKYFFDCMSDGTYRLSFRLDGFLTQNTEDVRYQWPEQLIVNQILNVDPEQASFQSYRCRLALEVRDAATGAPLGEVFIELSDSSESGVESGSTDDCGRVSFLLKCQGYSVSVSKGGFAGRILSTVLNEGLTRRVVPLKRK